MSNWDQMPQDSPKSNHEQAAPARLALGAEIMHWKCFGVNGLGGGQAVRADSATGIQGKA